MVLGGRLLLWFCYVVAMVLLDAAMVLLGGCYADARCCYGDARLLLWYCYMAAKVFIVSC